MKKIKTILNLVLCFCLLAQFTLDIYAQEKTTLQYSKYKKVAVGLHSDDTFDQIAKLGIDVHCGVHLSHNHTQGEMLSLEVSDYEYNQLVERGLNPTVLIDDLSNFYAKRNLADLPAAKKALSNKKAASQANKRFGQDMGCTEESYPVPQNFNLGSMGGFTTYQEMLNDLDKMANLYPNLISIKASASSIGQTTHQGRPLYYVKVSDNPNVDESEPEVLYTGLHHAREPLSMMNLQYYLWYLLENYNTNPTVKNIVDNTELYFIPFVNPDGYVYNQTTNPNGGGLWRKNRRNNGDGTYGVDLNRNYGYQWGYDNTGSNPNTNSGTYRGIAPFSEPETQIMKSFAESHNFINVFHNHSFSNFMLHPWGFNSTDSPDELLMDELSEQMCWHNRYAYGSTYDVLYAINGDACDWFYAEQTTKNKSLAWLPEIGSDAEGGFWSNVASIQDQCERHLKMSLIMAESATNHGIINDLSSYGLDSTTPSLTFSIQHMSLTPGSFTVSVSSTNPNVVSIANPVLSTTNLSNNMNETVSTTLNLANGITPGTLIDFKIVLNNGTYDLYETTITKMYNPPTVIYDDCNDLSNWTTNGWGIDNSTGYAANGSITDSPTGNSTSGTRTITLNNPLDLSAATNPVLEFYAKWDVFRLYSYAQLEISTNGSNWTDLCGSQTKPGANSNDFASGLGTISGTLDQPFGEALYDGYQEAFVREEIDLSSYAGVNSVYFRFTFRGDSDVNQKDGFWFDDFTVYREPLGHCENAVQDADETGVDCGGADCLACPTCFDGIQNGNETGTDCGGNCGVCPICPTSVNNFPNTEGFESGLGQWSQISGDDINWTRDSGGTPSSNTGPPSAYEGNWYMYIEASDPNYPTKTAGLSSPCFDLTGMATASLTFQYHMYGTSTDMNLNVQASIDGGNSWSTAMWSQTGNQGNQWNVATINLNAYVNQYVMLRILGTTGETWQGDIAIDDVAFDAAPLACTPGSACNDNDACTTGEIFDNNCQCNGGILLDSDGDGICDNSDQCPGANDGIIGAACTDNDACTTNDVYNSSCNCAGTFADADGDGVCDANDICANGDDTTDTDGDGTPDACDTCDDSLTGTSCSDGDPCTTGETYDATCNCIGGTFADADNDGVCDSNDQCPGNDDATIGTACNDNDTCTTNDVYNNSCNCAGTFADSDGDGVCDANDICPNGDDNTDNNSNGLPDACEPCPIYNFNTYPVLGYDPGQDFGPWNVQDNGATLYMTGNAWKAIDISYNITPQTVITFDFKSTTEGEIHELAFDDDLTLNRDQSIVVYGYQGYAGTLNNATYSGSGNWESFTVDIGAQFTGTYQYLVLTADDDANTTGNSYYRNIKFFEDTDGDLACDVLCTPTNACDDGDACTIGETYDNACNCIGGTIQDSDGDGVCDADDACAGSDDTADADGDGTPDGCDSCDSTTANTPCDDNNNCTTNDVTDANCNCVGTVADADSDGVCDANDVCANGDDNVDTDNDGTPDACDNCNNNLAGTSCSTGDACIVAQTYDANCNCIGGTTPDADGDGVCDANDICAAGDDNVDADSDGTPDACDSCPNDANNSCGLPTYCSSSASNSTYEHIANVSFGPINNTSGTNNGYGDYTNISGNIVLGATIPVSLTAGYASTTYPENWIVWIDYNRDGDFDDAGEEAFSGTGTGTVTGNITIPNNANLGATAMRVSMAWNASPTTCGSINYGEVEDYTLVISTVAARFAAAPTVDEESLKATTLNTLQIYPNPVKDYINVNLLSIFRAIESDIETNVKIFSTDGKLIMNKVIASDALLQIGVQNLPADQYYLISVEIKDKTILSNKFLKL